MRLSLLAGLSAKTDLGQSANRIHLSYVLQTEQDDEIDQLKT